MFNAVETTHFKYQHFFHEHPTTKNKGLHLHVPQPMSRWWFQTFRKMFAPKPWGFMIQFDGWGCFSNGLVTNHQLLIVCWNCGSTWGAIWSYSQGSISTSQPCPPTHVPVLVVYKKYQVLLEVGLGRKASFRHANDRPHLLGMATSTYAGD